MAARLIVATVSYCTVDIYSWRKKTNTHRSHVIVFHSNLKQFLLWQETAALPGNQSSQTKSLTVLKTWSLYIILSDGKSSQFRTETNYIVAMSREFSLSNLYIYY